MKFSIRFLLSTMVIVSVAAAVLRVAGYHARETAEILCMIAFPALAYYATSIFQWKQADAQIRVVMALTGVMLITFVAIITFTAGIDKLAGALLAMFFVAMICWLPQFLLMILYQDAASGERLAQLRKDRQPDEIHIESNTDSPTEAEQPP